MISYMSTAYSVTECLGEKYCRLQDDRDIDGHVTVTLTLKVTEQSGFDTQVPKRKDSVSASLLQTLTITQAVLSTTHIIQYLHLFGEC